MSSREVKPEIRLEIGHVLFIDIVGYSKLLISEQSDHFQKLKEILRGTEQFRLAEAEGKLLRLPTGDGGALVFRNNPEAPVLCAMEISKELKKHAELKVRMGVHSGPVNEITDLNEQANIAGAGINVAQRVMDCGDAGHILLSQHVADDLEQYPRWRPYLHELGTFEVKHGVRVNVANLYSDEFGNARLPAKFQAIKKRRAHLRWAAVAMGLLLLGAIVGGAFFFLRRPASAIVEKSIAVLPLVNSTGDPANEYFSDGMSEEFISTLSRLQELKVIGRTSSFQFKGKTYDSKTIGEKLGVYYLLEGSVRKSADRVRIAVALIKSADGANVWSETYDRELKDIFAVQSEIAGAVAKQLNVALLGHDGQSAQLATAATPSNQNVDAYNALLQGNFYFYRHTADDTRKAIDYYEEAIRLDPRYALAHAKLSSAADTLAFNYVVPVQEREEAIAKAHASARSALDLAPNLPEAHSAQGTVLQTLDLNLVAAEAEFRRAVELGPQNASALANLASLLDDLGRLDEAITLRQRAIEIDPLRASFHQELAFDLIPLGRYDEAEAALRKAIELQPQAAISHSRLAVIQILRGKPGAAVELAKQETDPFWRTYALALAQFANGAHSEADAALKKLINEDADTSGSQIAEVYALRKEPEKMFEWLEHAWTTHDGGVNEMLNDPFLLAYKDDPRFIAFAQKIGVMPKAAGKP
jgi:TolB-like protein/Flp pilus assembly protein TadD